MDKTAEQGRQEVAKLVEHYSRNAVAYNATGVKEAHVRQSLVNPFFEALGWDVRNKAMTAPQYREVIPEDSLDVEGHQKAPDYTFRIGTLPKFYVEAKKIGVNISNDPAPAYQLRRYGWSARVAVSILTDFEELSVYDCTIRPRGSDKASYARILYLRYDQYCEHWQEIWDIFSREAAWSGAFDQYAASKRKHGTSEVDVEFLKEIESWREALAHNIAVRNTELSPDDLNLAVQLTIDRIVFLRMAEDRGLEPEAQLLRLAEGTEAYKRFIRDVCHRADQKYNSGLFHFHVEKGVSESPDRITPSLDIDDKVLRPILESLYFEHGSPYHFGVLPVEILGTVYERFLGKVIRLTPGHHAKVEEKPEVRKAGGVYYTPAFIVEYIVKNTVARQVAGRSPSQLSGRSEKSRFRVLDMACGSGSFLLGAFQCLIDHCLQWNVENGSAAKSKVLASDPRSGEYRLTIEEKKRILTHHIFGVDIDPQAVEVTKLSLLLKVLEGESDQTIGQQMELFHRRALPNLADNIKCGNSLIGPDYLDGKLISVPEEVTRIRPFDWQQNFPAAMDAGGFDSVIGNPPYVLLQDEFRDSSQLEYFKAKYEVASYKLDTYHLFMERAIQMTKLAGSASMITPANFMTNNHLDKLRKLLLRGTKIDHILVIDGGVFNRVSVDNAVFVLIKAPTGTKTFELIHARVADPIITTSKATTIRAADVLSDSLSLFTGGSGRMLSQLWRRIEEANTSLGDVAKVNFGKQLRDRSVFTEDVIEVSSAGSVPPLYKPCYGGKDVRRYLLQWQRQACLDTDAARRGGCWDPGAQNAKNKLVTRQIGKFPSFALDEKGYQCLNVVFMVNIQTEDLDPCYLLGILNSSLLRAYWLEKFYDHRRTFPKIKGTYLKKLPVHLPDRERTQGRPDSERLIGMVKTMITLHAQLEACKSTSQMAVVQRQIFSTDKQIDALVYRLYGLVEHEIALVEAVEGTAVSSPDSVEEHQ